MNRIVLGLLCLISMAAIVHANPPPDGLVLWLDAAERATLTLSSNACLQAWQDKSGHNNHASPGSPSGPTWREGALNGMPAVRFSGEEWLELPALTTDEGGYSIFVVFQRTRDQSNGPDWQRLLSCTGEDPADDQNPPAFHLTTGASSGPMEPQVIHDLFSNASRTPITLGAYRKGLKSRLHGDISEVLVYNRSFLVHEPIQAVLDYLRGKWGIATEVTDDWTRKGPLPTPLPEHTCNDLPLSDQENVGNWKPFTPLWDEFDGDSLDRGKWWDHNPHWYGRAPGRFLARNVRVSNGNMGITMTRDASLPKKRFYGGTEYKDYASGSVVGRQPVRYGYFEIRARPMASAGSSAWWFAGRYRNVKDQTESWDEIDVFELGGKSIGKEHNYNMNLHVHRTRDNPKHHSQGGVWKAERPLADGFRVYGLEWTPEVIRYFVDGILVRSVKNTRWHGPQRMIFDSETMFDWLGVPEDSDLPSTFKVDYVRAWKNPTTDRPWDQQYRLVERTITTRYVRSVDPD